MSREITEVHQTNVMQERVQFGLEQLKHSLPLLRKCSATRREVEAILPSMTVPADMTWMMARIAALLSPYYEKEVPQGVRRIEAEDWAVALAEFPKWAIERSVRWWKSADNPNRRKRPLEGDIAARCKSEMEPIRAARIALASGEPLAVVPRTEADRTMPLAERRARASEIVQQAGFRCRLAGARQ